MASDVKVRLPYNSVFFVEEARESIVWCHNLIFLDVIILMRQILKWILENIQEKTIPGNSY